MEYDFTDQTQASQGIDTLAFIGIANIYDKLTYFRDEDDGEKIVLVFK